MSLTLATDWGSTGLPGRRHQEVGAAAPWSCCRHPQGPKGALRWKPGDKEWGSCHWTLPYHSPCALERHVFAAIPQGLVLILLFWTWTVERFCCLMKCHWQSLTLTTIFETSLTVTDKLITGCGVSHRRDLWKALATGFSLEDGKHHAYLSKQCGGPALGVNLHGRSVPQPCHGSARDDPKLPLWEGLSQRDSWM